MIRRDKMKIALFLTCVLYVFADVRAKSNGAGLFGVNPNQFSIPQSNNFHYSQNTYGSQRQDYNPAGNAEHYFVTAVKTNPVPPVAYQPPSYKPDTPFNGQSYIIEPSYLLKPYRTPEHVYHAQPFHHQVNPNQGYPQNYQAQVYPAYPSSSYQGPAYQAPVYQPQAYQPQSYQDAILQQPSVALIYSTPVVSSPSTELNHVKPYVPSAILEAVQQTNVIEKTTAKTSSAEFSTLIAKVEDQTVYQEAKKSADQVSASTSFVSQKGNTVQENSSSNQSPPKLVDLIYIPKTVGTSDAVTGNVPNASVEAVLEADDKKSKATIEDLSYSDKSNEESSVPINEASSSAKNSKETSKESIEANDNDQVNETRTREEDTKSKRPTEETIIDAKEALEPVTQIAVHVLQPRDKAVTTKESSDESGESIPAEPADGETAVEKKDESYLKSSGDYQESAVDSEAVRTEIEVKTNYTNQVDQVTNLKVVTYEDTGYQTQSPETVSPPTNNESSETTDSAQPVQPVQVDIHPANEAVAVKEEKLKVENKPDPKETVEVKTETTKYISDVKADSVEKVEGTDQKEEPAINENPYYSQEYLVSTDLIVTETNETEQVISQPGYKEEPKYETTTIKQAPVQEEIVAVPVQKKGLDIDTLFYPLVPLVNLNKKQIENRYSSAEVVKPQEVVEVKKEEPIVSDSLVYVQDPIEQTEQDSPATELPEKNEKIKSEPNIKIKLEIEEPKYEAPFYPLKNLFDSVKLEKIDDVPSNIPAVTKEEKDQYIETLFYSEIPTTGLNPEKIRPEIYVSSKKEDADVIEEATEAVLIKDENIIAKDTTQNTGLESLKQDEASKNNDSQQTYTTEVSYKEEPVLADEKEALMIVQAVPSGAYITESLPSELEDTELITDLPEEDRSVIRTPLSEKPNIKITLGYATKKSYSLTSDETAVGDVPLDYVKNQDTLTTSTDSLYETETEISVVFKEKYLEPLQEADLKKNALFKKVDEAVISVKNVSYEQVPDHESSLTDKDTTVLNQEISYNSNGTNSGEIVNSTEVPIEQEIVKTESDQDESPEEVLQSVTDSIDQDSPSEHVDQSTESYKDNKSSIVLIPSEISYDEEDVLTTPLPDTAAVVVGAAYHVTDDSGEFHQLEPLTKGVIIDEKLAQLPPCLAGKSHAPELYFNTAALAHIPLDSQEVEPLEDFTTVTLELTTQPATTLAAEVDSSAVDFKYLNQNETTSATTNSYEGRKFSPRRPSGRYFSTKSPNRDTVTEPSKPSTSAPLVVIGKATAEARKPINGRLYSRTSSVPQNRASSSLPQVKIVPTRLRVPSPSSSLRSRPQIDRRYFVGRPPVAYGRRNSEVDDISEFASLERLV